MDSYYNCLPFRIPETGYENQIVKTAGEYKRYGFSEDGISPRGVPGYGEGVVMVDSDEHDETGCITENMKVRIEMTDRRLKKLELITEDSLEPVLTGSKEYSTLLVSWGSTYHIVKEALECLERDDVSHLHLNQLYPIHKDVAKYIKKAEKTVIIENNATSQMGKLIKLHTGCDMDEKVLKYNGLPFFVDELTELLKRIV